MTSERRRSLAEARSAIADGRPDDAEEFTLEWIAAHSCDPIARELANGVFAKREEQ